ncbi:DUF6090 family protein [Flagellimonas amoyensis]|uniref:DUF6090 family protein n=1 Tax=Flagellimonas amoyensis TaxID=2169401 RepID=UPI000D3D21EC|nr:DUF6090 family protein [Allomuricauda amoyensis]
MIKFFRRIRHKALTENKFGKYLTYAIGEIILVVIGILIALQVNNWNESRKNSLVKSSYTHSLINDFKKDSVALGSLLSRLEKDSIAFRNFQNRIKLSESKFDTLVKIYRSEFPFFYMGNYGFNNTTLINLVGNNEISYPSDIRDALASLIKNQKDFENINSIFGEKYFDILNENTYYLADDYFFDSGKEVRDITWDNVDKTQFLRDFERLADWKMAYTEVILNFGRQILVNSNELKVQLEKSENK